MDQSSPESSSGSSSESRWPASLAVLAALAMYVTLPERYTAGPVWLLPALEAALLVPLTLAVPRREADEPWWHRAVSVGLIGIVNLANFASLLLLIRSLLRGTEARGTSLFFAAIQMWLTNVIVFGLWYWEVDRGGPSARARPDQQPPDFLFPQMSIPSVAPGWSPKFLDYLYVAFTNAMAFSPTDTLPLTATAKLLMLVQSLASLLTIAIVAARSVNILQ